MLLVSELNKITIKFIERVNAFESFFFFIISSHATKHGLVTLTGSFQNTSSTFNCSNKVLAA